MSTPTHAIVIDLEDGDRRLDCTAPAGAPCHAVWECNCESFYDLTTVDGQPTHRPWYDDGEGHTGRFDMNYCAVESWWGADDNCSIGLVRVPVEVDWDDALILAPVSAHLIGSPDFTVDVQLDLTTPTRKDQP